jgi:hypothetical protein
MGIECDLLLFRSSGVVVCVRVKISALCIDVSDAYDRSESDIWKVVISVTVPVESKRTYRHKYLPFPFPGACAGIRSS